VSRANHGVIAPDRKSSQCMHAKPITGQKLYGSPQLSTKEEIT
jgi:hypothetical protein